jgi:hypothetical protein
MRMDSLSDSNRTSFGHTDYFNSFEKSASCMWRSFFGDFAGRFSFRKTKEKNQLVIQRGGTKFVYQSIREKGRVKKIYIGKLSSKPAQDFMKEQSRKEAEKAEKKKLNADIEAMVERIEDCSHMTNILIRTGLLLNGHYLRKSEYRKLKGVI